MASVVKIKRSAIPGRAPNTSILSTGELALNLADKKLYSSDGSAVFEIGANVSSLTVNNYSFPLTDGANGQVLVTDGSGNLTFQNQSGGSGGGASVTTGTTPPASPSTGDLWFDTDEAILYVYLDSAWVQSVPGSTGGGTANLEGYTSNAYVTSTYVTNTAFQSYVANTNPRFAQYLEVANANFDQYLQVANSTDFLVQTDVDKYLEVANSTNFLVQADVDGYLQVANVAGYGFATETYVDNQVAALVNAAPTTLNTLDELAQALGDDANFATSVTTTLGTKASNTYVNTLLANTNSYIASVSDAQSQYLQVANSTNFLVQADVDKYLEVANADFGSSIYVQNTAPTITANGEMWWDNSTGELYVAYANNWVEAVAQDVTPYTNNASYSTGNTTLTFVRTDGSQYEVTVDLSGVGEVSNSYLTSTYVTNTSFQSYVANTNPRFAEYLQVANSTSFITSTALSPYLEVANSTNFLVQADVDKYLEVANANFATESYVDTSVAALVNSAPTTLNTLDELAQALGDDANFATTTTTLIGTKASNTYVNTLLANTNAYIETKANTSMLSAYLEVANVVSGGASITVQNTAPTISANGEMWWDNSTGELYISYSNNWVEAVAQDVTPYTNNASYSTGNSTITFVRTDGSQYDVAISASIEDGSNASLNVLTANTIAFGNNATLSWNTIDGTIDIAYDSVALQVGQEQHYYVKFTEAVNNGDVIMFAGSQGDHALAAKADMNAVGFIPEYIMGVATASYAINAYGYVTSFGKVRSIDTRTYGAGALLYLSANTPGLLTTTEPEATEGHSILIAASLDETVNGTILVRPTHKSDLDELHNVDITGRANNDLLFWNNATGHWETTDAYSTTAELNGIFTTNTAFQSFVSNTNTAIADRMQVANVVSYVATSIANLVNTAPTTLNTLDELAAALGDDANYAATTATLIGTKASNTYVNTLLANTNSYIASVSDAQSQYLQVANTTALLAPYMEVANVISYTSKYLEVANVETGGASIEVSNTAPTITANGQLWWDNSTGELFISYSNNWIEAVEQDVTPYTNNAVYTASNSTITFVRTDDSQYDVTVTVDGTWLGNTSTSTGTAQYVIDSFDKSIQSAMFYVEASDATGVHTTTVNMLHHANTVHLTEYATLISNSSLMTIDADANTTHIRLLATPASSGITINTKRINF